MIYIGDNIILCSRYHTKLVLLTTHACVIANDSLVTEFRYRMIQSEIHV